MLIIQKKNSISKQDFVNDIKCSTIFFVDLFVETSINLIMYKFLSQQREIFRYNMSCVNQLKHVYLMMETYYLAIYVKIIISIEILINSKDLIGFNLVIVTNIVK